MLAKKCDRCGQLYVSSERVIDEKKVDAVIIASRSNFYAGINEERRAYDLCNDCLEEFEDWLKIKGVEE